MTSERDTRSLIPQMPQNGEIQISDYSDAMQSGWMHYIYYIISTYSCASALTYLFTYTVGLERIKPANINTHGT